ncbi:cytochrome P450 [Myxococcus sp. CA040A]|uniref:cytochrome P450 n=1 Tax=Myxococcus sp. CA040A TaxID=2741738 RepID=UPI00157A60D0|nr:cytochrome P450 [Myxococcus sp. CA040A]NTX03357.1 cytochrome P450 [Myxococcus sp. CA040A]
MSPPLDPIAAATHPDPYPFYADLVSRRPLYWDDSLRLWVASSSEAVQAVLTHPSCRVRPVSEPVPRALLGSAPGEVFRRLARMNDGSSHAFARRALVALMRTWEPPQGIEVSGRWTRQLSLSAPSHTLTFLLPVYVLGELLGLSSESLPQVASWTRDFVRCIVPGAHPDTLGPATLAARSLLSVFRSALEAQLAPGSSGGPLAVLAHETASLGPQDSSEVVVANAIGLLLQTHDATAGLLGQALRALLTDSSLLMEVRDDVSLLPSFLDEVLRFESPVQNTRRFLAEDAVVAGQAMASGDAVLVVLAAANRDPALHPEPQRFDLHRAHPRALAFGAGAHVCPGDGLAKSIVHGALLALLSSDLRVLRAAALGATWMPSLNSRIPVFAAPVLLEAQP